MMKQTLQQLYICVCVSIYILCVSLQCPTDGIRMGFYCPTRSYVKGPKMVLELDVCHMYTPLGLKSMGPLYGQMGPFLSTGALLDPFPHHLSKPKQKEKGKRKRNMLYLWNCTVPFQAKGQERRVFKTYIYRNTLLSGIRLSDGEREGERERGNSRD